MPKPLPISEFFAQTLRSGPAQLDRISGFQSDPSAG